MPATNPLLKPHLDSLAGLNGVDPTEPEEVERRAQEILNEWLKFYFSGEPFRSPSRGRPDRMVTLEKLEILFDHATSKSPGEVPIMHTVVADRREEKVRVGGRVRMEGKWTWNTFIRASPQLPAGADAQDPKFDSARATAFRSVRRAGDQYVAMLRGSHSQDLALKGLCHLRVLSGPRAVPAAAWIMRQITFETEVGYFIEDDEL